MWFTTPSKISQFPSKLNHFQWFDLQNAQKSKHWRQQCVFARKSLGALSSTKDCLITCRTQQTQVLHQSLKDYTQSFLMHQSYEELLVGRVMGTNKGHSTVVSIVSSLETSKEEAVCVEERCRCVWNTMALEADRRTWLGGAVRLRRRDTEVWRWKFGREMASHGIIMSWTLHNKIKAADFSCVVRDHFPWRFDIPVPFGFRWFIQLISGDNFCGSIRGPCYRLPGGQIEVTMIL